MRRMIVGVAAWAILVGAQTASSPFTGTWVADLDAQSGLGKDIYLVVNGTYRCDSCSPPRSYRADGKPHKVFGASERTTESVTVAGPRTIVTRIAEPSMRRVTTMTVAPDDRTATYVSIDHRPRIAQALKTIYLARRTAPAASGAHRVSGTWQGVRYVSVPELIRTTQLRDDGRQLTYRVPIGVTYRARFGGGFVHVEGPHKGMLAAVERDGPRKIVETRKQGGKVVLVRTFTVSGDGRSLTIASKNVENGSTFSIVAHRKS
jgi:hypothetical protein